jgi:hypothetical protein
VEFIQGVPPHGEVICCEPDPWVAAVEVRGGATLQPSILPPPCFLPCSTSYQLEHGIAVRLKWNSNQH